jgi:limonene-1,2-epoxide hydrolase
MEADHDDPRERRSSQRPPTTDGRAERSRSRRDARALRSGVSERTAAHPKRAFTGIEQVRKNWSALLTAIPDFRLDVLRTAVDGETVWMESHWSGTKADGSSLDEMVIGIFGIRDGHIAWGRLYSESIDREGEDIDERMRRLAGTSDDA